MLGYYDALLNLIYPSRCAGCFKLTDDLLCQKCAALLPKLDNNVCQYCGKPVITTVENCRECRTKRLYFDSARAVWAFDGLARDIIHDYKYKNQKHLAGKLAKRLVPLVKNTDLITWVPLSRKKQWARGYNQAQLLAKRLSRLTGEPSAALLTRNRYTDDQNQLDILGRKKNVRDAFGIRQTHRVAGAKITLIDDVYTSGSTVAECSRVLKKNGAISVDILTLARTLLHT